jgi:hypothetical protein
VALIVPFTSRVNYGFVVPIPILTGPPKLSVIDKLEATIFNGYSVVVVLSIDSILAVSFVPS